LLTKNALVRTSEFPFELQQTCSILALVLCCIFALYHDRNTVDEHDDVIKSLLRGIPCLGLALGPASARASPAGRHGHLQKFF